MRTESQVWGLIYSFLLVTIRNILWRQTSPSGFGLSTERSDTKSNRSHYSTPNYDLIPCAVKTIILISEWVRAGGKGVLVRAPQSKSRKICSNNWDLPRWATCSFGTVSGGAFFGENFYIEKHLNSKERVIAKARLTDLEDVKLLEFSPPWRFSEPIENWCCSWPSWSTCVLLHCSHLPSLWFTS